MNKKISMGAAVSLAIMFAAVTFIITMIYSARIFDGKMTDIKKRESIYDKLNEVDLYIRENFYGEINEEILLDNIIEGYVEGLEDGYGLYLTAEEYARITSSTAGNTVGIGATFVKDVDGYIKVDEIYDNSPAGSAGIAVGDIIVKVDDIAVSNETYDQALEGIYGEPGTTVVVRVRQETNEVDLELTRRSVEVPTIDYRFIDNVAYLRIKEFNSTTTSQFQRAMAEIINAQVGGIVFDVRGNPGGTITAVTDILDMLLPEGDIVYATYRNGTKEVLATSDAAYIDLPMTVLINENTASAAELFAQALVDYDMADTVGVTTYGKGSMQNIKKLTDGSAIDITVATYSTPITGEIDGIGVRPDYEVRIPYEFVSTFYLLDENSDAQLKKAIEILSVQIKNVESTIPPVEEDSSSLAEGEEFIEIYDEEEEEFLEIIDDEEQDGEEITDEETVEE